MYSRRFLLCILVIVMNTVIFAKNYTVSSAQDIDDVMINAQPGDVLFMTNGTWEDQEIELDADGAKGDSIVLRAGTPGNVVLNGESRLSIDGSYLKVDGLRFVGGYNPNDEPINFSKNSEHCRLTNTQISEFNPPDESTDYHWVVLKGFNNRIDHCSFSGKRSEGVDVVVKLRQKPYGYHRIDHNYFGERAEGPGNGYEALKVNSGAYSTWEGHISVEYNYFYRCNGEMEIVSNKCLYNTYRYNTFVECQGTFTLRQGTHCTVEGNYFLGNNIPNTGGIRVCHRGHKIINNYFQNLGGDEKRSAITLMAGMGHDDYIPGEGGHVRVDSTLIAHNTIVNCEQGIYSGGFDKDDDILLAPKYNVFANNIISMDNDNICFKMNPNYPGEDQVWEGNILNGDNLGDVPDTGYTVDDPELTFSDGWFQISENSPAVDAGVGDYPDVIEDIDGIIRDEDKDVGADELGSGPRKPLTEQDVGPDWKKNTDLPVVLAVRKIGDGKGEVVLDPTGGVYERGTRVTLTAVPDEEHEFAGWSGDLMGVENPNSIVMDSDKIIAAEFNPPVRYKLSVWTTGSGEVSFEPPGGSYPESTVVKVTAIADENWEFSSWGGALSGYSNPDSVLMNSDKALTVTFTQSVNVEKDVNTLLSNRLQKNYPNPFNPITTIPFTLRHSGYTVINVYDLSGQKMANVVNRKLDAGHHEVQFDASQLNSGVYIYSIKSGNFSATKKMILIR